jgi:hypothetical protein
MGVVLCPILRRNRVAYFNFAPRETFPQTEVDFAQPRPNVESYSEMLGNRLSSLSGTPKVAGIDPADCVLR